jgi:hypothetical protein
MVRSDDFSRLTAQGFTSARYYKQLELIVHSGDFSRLTAQANYMRQLLQTGQKRGERLHSYSLGTTPYSRSTARSNSFMAVAIENRR